MPVISVGNLEVGGAGKSPMTEYLVRLFKDHYKLATLSRGYGRKTKGFLTVATDSTAEQVGDEPLQFKHKFPDITVVVCEKRVDGLKELTHTHNLVLMDDAYQHRAVKPALSILLFDYNRINEPHLLLPAGNLREPFSGRWRADIIVISKCPGQLSVEEQKAIINSIEPLPLQDLSGRKSDLVLDNDTTVVLLTGIANPKPLLQHIKKHTSKLVHHNYPDHHRFSLKNISKLAHEFAACTTQKKVIITTEKDAQRLLEHELLPLVQSLPVLVIPIGGQFLNNEAQQFDQ